MVQFWDERYGGDDYVYGKEPNDFLKAEAHRIPKGRVLCLAEGEGRNAVYLAGLGHDVTMVDQSAAGLGKARQLAKDKGVTIRTIRADLADFTPEGTFSGIVAIFAHLPATLRTKAYGAAARALVPGGVFVLEAYTPAQLAHGTGGPKDVALLMTVDALRKDLDVLDLVIAREIERDVVEGAFHTGKAATVQICGVRRSK
jgi:SAM-dependent methyltransferase